jgi:murein DD-endopeptidase
MRSSPLFAAMILSSLCCQFGASAQTRSPVNESLESRLLAAPAVTSIAGRDQLVYEVHLTNLRPLAISLERVVVRNSSVPAPMAVLGGNEIELRIGHPAGSSSNPRQLAPGARAILYFWIPLDPAITTGSRVWHQIEFDVITASGREHVSMADEGVTLQRIPPTVLGPPLRGGLWAAVYDPLLERGHRTAVYTIDGRARIPARFAIDWFGLRADATHARREGKNVSDWHGYDSEVLAVADAMVADARDDIDEQELIGASRHTALQDASGNYVVLDLGAGRYAFYEHLRRGTVRVRPGERVSEGQVIGRLGNSGSSSSGPHLHFHVSDTASVLGAEGLPYALRCFNVKGGYDTIGGFASNKPWLPVPVAEGGERRNELPAPNVVVDFSTCR